MTTPVARAKEALSAYYREHGVMPTVKALAELLGYSSTSSAHFILEKLQLEGFLAKTDAGGKLMPGPHFIKAPGGPPTIPAALLEVLPAGADLKVLRVDGDWRVDASIRAGDLLVVAPAGQAQAGDTVVLRRGQTFVVAQELRSGWRPLGVVVGQYRAFNSAG